MPIYVFVCSNCNQETTEMESTPPSVCPWCRRQGTLSFKKKKEDNE